MRYVILRDDDTNALTPVACLERLYRPFLDRGLPVNLATIPRVAIGTRTPDGRLEGYLSAGERFRQSELQRPTPGPAGALPMTENQKLVRYLLDNPGYQIVQHGLHHDYLEFERLSEMDAVERLAEGTKTLLSAGFPRPQTFVAPYDKMSRATLPRVAAQFRVVSTGCYELERLPRKWWPRYLWKKARGAAHWRVASTLLLSHPGCLLSCFRDYDTMLENILRHVNKHHLTVLVTHWWEYFRNDSPDEAFMGVLHETCNYLATHPDIKVISFSELAAGRISLN